MKIVITDGYALNPGDLDWKPVQQLGEVVYFDRTVKEEIVERCRGAEIVVTNKTPMSSESMAALPELKMIAVTATGYNIVDMKAAADRGITVCNVPVYSTDSVAQHTISLILELTNHTGMHIQSVRRGDWSLASDWCYTIRPVMELRGKTLGIIGFGRIGQRVSEIARALGMDIIFYNKGKKSDLAEDVSMEQLFERSDIVTLHCPWNKDNDKFVNRRMLSLMKPDAFLVNTSRGALIDEDDLADALRNRVLKGAALDVLTIEPPPPGNALIELPNCIITPHNAWISFEARKRLMETTAGNIKAFLDGKPVNVVS